MKKYLWDITAWEPDYPPENAEEIVNRVNEILEAYADSHNDEDTMEYSNTLWEQYCFWADIIAEV